MTLIKGDKLHEFPPQTLGLKYPKSLITISIQILYLKLKLEILYLFNKVNISVGNSF